MKELYSNRVLPIHTNQQPLFTAWGQRIMAFAASKCPLHMITIWSFIQSSAPLRLDASIFFRDSFVYVNTMATTKTKRKRFSGRWNKVQKDFRTRILEGLKWSKDGNSRAPVVWKTWKMPEFGKHSLKAQVLENWWVRLADGKDEWAKTHSAGSCNSGYLPFDMFPIPLTVQYRKHTRTQTVDSRG